jgi:hypothetical protein
VTRVALVRPEAAHLGVGRGRDREHLRDRGHAREHGPGAVDVAAQVLGRRRRGERLAEPRPLERRDRLVVAGDGDVDDLLEQRALVPEREVDGLDGDAGARRDLLQRRRAVAALDEQLAGRFDDPPPRRPRALGTDGVVGCGHLPIIALELYTRVLL